MKENKNILPDKPGFTIPNDYFAMMEEELLSKIASENKLFSDKYSAGFKVPEAYFDNVEKAVLQRIETPLKTEDRKKDFFYMAAAIAAVILLYFGINIEKSSINSVTWDSVELSAIENYIDDGYEMGFIDLNPTEYSEFIDANDDLISDEDFKVVNEDVALDYIDGNLENSDFIIE